MDREREKERKRSKVAMKEREKREDGRDYGFTFKGKYLGERGWASLRRLGMKNERRVVLTGHKNQLWFESSSGRESKCREPLIHISRKLACGANAGGTRGPQKYLKMENRLN